uniref:Uncharacterized protein n=1 Tax=Anguilla anguilla TaxID=7936 RepID=A0A0E9XDY1_ANGAN
MKIVFVVVVYSERIPDLPNISIYEQNRKKPKADYSKQDKSDILEVIQLKPMKNKPLE